MSARSRDKVYGRRGGGWVDGDGSGNRLTGPPCDVCGAPMLVGQKERHLTCSPPLECCGAPVDLVGDVDAHRKAHRELALEALERGQR